MPDRRKKKGTIYDRHIGEPRSLHRADDIRTKWQFFAFAMEYFSKHWFKFIMLILIVGGISFAILKYTDLIDVLVGK